jgi:hypothetical protein
MSMQRHPLEFRCDLCRRRVDEELFARARRGWEPLVICDACLRDAAPSDNRPASALTSAAR